jgi:hypothetical protein
MRRYKPKSPILIASRGGSFSGDNTRNLGLRGRECRSHLGQSLTIEDFPGNLEKLAFLFVDVVL